MFAGVRPSISCASVPTASIEPLAVLNATIDGSFRTMPRPRAKTQVFAVPRSIATSVANAEKKFIKGLRDRTSWQVGCRSQPPCRSFRRRGAVAELPCRHKSFRVLPDNGFAQSLEIPRIVVLARSCTTLRTITNLKQDYDSGWCSRPTSIFRPLFAVCAHVR